MLFPSPVFVKFGGIFKNGGSSFKVQPRVEIETSLLNFLTHLQGLNFKLQDLTGKPMSKSTWKNNLEKNNTHAGHIFIKSSNKFFKINFSEIIFIEAMKDYLKIHTSEYNLVTLQTMSEMEKLLPAKQFLRVHKSFIVAIAHIKTVYGGSIELEKATIPIGSSYKNNVMNFIARK